MEPNKQQEEEYWLKITDPIKRSNIRAFAEDLCRRNRERMGVGEFSLDKLDPPPDCATCRHAENYGEKVVFACKVPTGKCLLQGRLEAVNEHGHLVDKWTPPDDAYPRVWNCPRYENK